MYKLIIFKTCISAGWTVRESSLSRYPYDITRIISLHLLISTARMATSSSIYYCLYQLTKLLFFTYTKIVIFFSDLLCPWTFVLELVWTLADFNEKCLVHSCFICLMCGELHRFTLLSFAEIYLKHIKNAWCFILVVPFCNRYYMPATRFLSIAYINIRSI